MSSQNAGGSTSTLVEPTRKSGLRAALEYTGVPPSWLDKRPRLPSRNWLIFLSITSSITGLYIYDRQQCKRIKQEYVDKVKHLSEETSDHLSWPRRVKVYGAKWPGDEDYDQCMRYFRKYVKPIFVAAAVDYEMIVGKKHGDIMNRIANEIKARRRLDAGLDQPLSQSLLPPGYPVRSTAELRQHELEGGIVLVGRPTWKEFMAGLKRGWTEGLDKVDHDEILAQELETDGRFDEPEEPADPLGEDSTPSSSSQPSPLSASKSPVFSALQYRVPPAAPPQAKTASSIPESLNSPPAVIPQLPPLLFVPFIDYLGFTQVPLMIWGFFNQRHKVRDGSEAALRLVMNSTRPFASPSSPSSQPLFADITSPHTLTSQSDLDFDKEAESYYRSSLSSTVQDVEKARQKYYDALPAKLETARALARGTREPTKEERDNPPPTEVELRAQRMEKEKKWRAEIDGWNLVRPDKEVEWDERFADALRVFVDPPQNESRADSAAEKE